MLTVAWPSNIEENAQVWRVLDLSGMTKSVRDSRNFTRAGYVYLSGNLVGIRTRIPTGSLFTLEIRFPNGKIVSREIRLVTNLHRRIPRSNEPLTLHRRG